MAPQRPRSTTSKARIWAALGGAALLGIAVATMVSGQIGPRRDEPTGALPSGAPRDVVAPPPSTPSPAPSAPAPIAEAVVTSQVLTLRVEVDPPDAKIFVDDVKVAGPKYEGTFPKDGANHRLRVEAAGFTTEKRLILFDADREEKITLTRADAAARVDAPKPADPPSLADPPKPVVIAQPPPTERPAGPGKPPKRVVEPGDPWAK